MHILMHITTIAHTNAHNNAYKLLMHINTNALY